MRGKIITVLLSACCFAGTNALAHAARAREAHVVIQSVERQTQTLTLAYHQVGGQQKLLWNGVQSSCATGSLYQPLNRRKGAARRFTTIHPFLGKPLVTRVAWASANQVGGEECGSGALLVNRVGDYEVNPSS
jgi:hypothetical protein